MKIRILMATATAAGVLMAASAAMADNNIAVLAQIGAGGNSGSIEQIGGVGSGQGNVAKATQDGSSNTLSIKQNGKANSAGTHMKTLAHDNSGDTYSNYNYILQKGDSNNITVDQSGRGNSFAVGYTSSESSVNQVGNWNNIIVTQLGGASDGGNVNWVTQTANSATGSSSSNKLTVHQSGAAPGTYTPSIPSSDYNYALASVVQVVQTQTGSALNEIKITQSGGVYNAGNLVTLARQVGSDNYATVTQAGRLNTLTTLDQLDGSNWASLTQSGYNNLTKLIYQDSNGAVGNTATLSLTGIDNGRDALVGGAGLAGALWATVQQIGDENEVNYTALGDDNAYGFYQEGNRNLAVGISITGNSNHLGVYQKGDDNKLTLASINGNGNVIGVKQVGNTNEVKVTIAVGGDDNGGSAAFSSSLASSSGLTSGLIGQTGNLNKAEFNVTGDDNLFASQSTGNSNKIKATINGGSNQSAILQNGNNNNATLTQIGSGNDAIISQ